MVFVVFPNDVSGRDLTTLEEIDGFITKEIIPRLDVPDNYRVIFDGATLYMELNGGVTPVGTPFSKKTDVTYLDAVVSKLNEKIKKITQDLGEQSSIKAIHYSDI